ncbi:MAG: SdrD B-like domain-containing protein [Anaerolineae bacterium]
MLSFSEVIAGITNVLNHHIAAHHRSVRLLPAVVLGLLLMGVALALIAPGNTAYAQPVQPLHSDVEGRDIPSLRPAALTGTVCATHTWWSSSQSVWVTNGTITRTIGTPPSRLTFDDGKVAYAFCTDISHGLSSDQRMCLDSSFFSDWRVAWLVTNYPPITTDQVKQAARQAAVWHFTDGYTLTVNNLNDDIRNAYWAILASIPPAPPPEYQPGNVDIVIEPANATNFLPGQEVHPLTVRLTKGGQPLIGYTVSVSASRGTLDKNSGTTDATGSVPFTLTNGTGFSGTAYITATARVTLPAGSRFVHATDPLGKQRLVLGQSTPVTVTATARKTWISATNVIIAHKFEDSNYNAVQDAGEPDLSGWVFTLTVPSGATYTSTTGADGRAYFYNKVGDDGAYTLMETPKSPTWTNTTPLSQTCWRSNGQGCSAWIAHFGNARYSIIEVIKFLDLDGDGVWDTGEPPLPNWQFELRKGDAAYLGGTTGPDGRLSFTHLDGGSYTVLEHLKPGYTNTTAISQTLNLGYPEKKTLYFGNRGALSISGMKWNDVDGDGQKDSEESGLLGWEITLSGGPRNLITSTLTDDSGAYHFDNLEPGVYVVSETLRSGWTQTYPETPGTHTVTLTDQSVRGVDFGNRRATTTLLAFKWEDTDYYGNYDPGENPIAGWTLCLEGDDCKQTNDSGFAQWDNLSIGKYNVYETLPEGWASSTPLTQTGYAYAAALSGSPGPTYASIPLNDNKNTVIDVAWLSVVDRTWTYTVTEVSGRDLSHWLLGIVTCVDPSHIVSATPGYSVGYDGSTGFTGIKWDVEDPFKTGVFTFTLDTDYPAGTVEALVKAGNAFATGNIRGPICGPMFGNYKLAKLVVDKVTDPAGSAESFRFELTQPGGITQTFTLTDTQAPFDSGALVPGVYTVTEAVPDGWDLTGATCSDGSPVDAIDLQAGEVVTCTFTNTQRGEIVVVKETEPAGAVGEFTFTASYTDAFTLGDGDEHHSGWLVPGVYTVTEAVPAGWDLTGAMCNDESDPAEGIALAAGEVVTCTFTNTQRSSVTVHKFSDVDGDGTQDPGEPDLSGWEMQLYQGANCSVQLVVTATTGVEGDVVFGNLVAGAYSVKEELQSGWENTTAVCQNVTLTPGDAERLTFGNRQLGSLRVTKSVDWNEVQPGEDQSFQICIGGPSYPEGSCQTVGYNGGELTWDDLISGTYVITETDPGVAWTVQGSGVAVQVEAGCVLPEGENGVAAALIDTLPESPQCPAVTITNTRRLGVLQVTKLVEWNGVPADREQDFQICIQGPSYPTTPHCQMLDNAPTGGALTWLNLVPGVYTVTETAPAPVGAWTVQINPTQVTVPVDGSPARATVINSRKAPSLVLDKEVEGSGDAVNGLITFTLRITNTGPTALKLVPLTDVFTGPVQFVGSQPPADSVAGNQIRWNNLVDKFGGTPLPSGNSFLVRVTFRVTSTDPTFNMDNTGIVEGAKDIYDTPVPRAEDTVPLRNKATAVTLLSFIVEPTPQGIRLRWETAVEIDNYGFRLWRSTTGRLEDARDIDAFIPGQGYGTQDGASYEYLDTAVTPGQRYTYWLVDVDFNGNETVHPESAVAAMNGGGSHTIFLPVVAK